MRTEVSPPVLCKHFLALIGANERVETRRWHAVATVVLSEEGFRSAF